MPIATVNIKVQVNDALDFLFDLYLKVFAWFSKVVLDQARELPELKDFNLMDLWEVTIIIIITSFANFLIKVLEHRQQTPVHKDLVVEPKDAQVVQEWVELKPTIYLEVEI